MQSLVLTLGHNSSAILVNDGHIICGYENERLSGIKSDSQFPALAIEEIQKYYGFVNPLSIYVSHWFIDGKLPDNDKKHWDPQYIEDNFKWAKIYSLNQNLTHHDSHMLSAEVFAKGFPEEHHTLVVDGFGTHGECVSVYHNTHLISRCYGFHRSVGLMYQYATDYCGMKMHQDEYKMLGYEAKIHTLYNDLTELNHEIDYMSDFFDVYSADFMEKCVDALAYIKDMTHTHLNTFLNKQIEKLGRLLNQNEIRIIISYVIQRHLENILSGLVSALDIKNLVLVGGVFYNVKLNHVLSELVDKICVMPLAGDQGAGLGVYQYYNNDLVWPGHVFWGKRHLPKYHGKVLNSLARDIYQYGMVNLIRGHMEFGPRALGHTSTLAIPTIGNVDTINMMNGRSTIMPMALMVTEDQAKYLFIDVDKVYKSLDYMIITRTFKPGRQLDLEGGALYYPYIDKWTCRPQITYDPLMVDLLNTFGPLINTSANYHGQPIVCTDDQINYMMLQQNKVDHINLIMTED